MELVEKANETGTPVNELEIKEENVPEGHVSQQTDISKERLKDLETDNNETTGLEKEEINENMLNDSVSDSNAIATELPKKPCDFELTETDASNDIHPVIETDKSDIESKIDDLLSKTLSSSDGDFENEENHFFDLMAEEGEEDTPSEGSNDIVEVGEEINTTESEYSTDESYEKNSFIDDEENYQLLSGEEYDLSPEQPKRKTRILRLSSGSDDELVKIVRTKKEQPKRKRSRIIKFSDSSDDEIVDNVDEIKIESKENETCNSNNIVEEIPDNNKKNEASNSNKIVEEIPHNNKKNEAEHDEINIPENKDPETAVVTNVQNHEEGSCKIVECKEEEAATNADNKEVNKNSNELITSPAVIEQNINNTDTSENIKVQDIHNTLLDNHIHDAVSVPEVKCESEMSTNLSSECAEIAPNSNNKDKLSERLDVESLMDADTKNETDEMEVQKSCRKRKISDENSSIIENASVCETKNKKRKRNRRKKKRKCSSQNSIENTFLKRFSTLDNNTLVVHNNALHVGDNSLKCDDQKVTNLSEENGRDQQDHNHVPEKKYRKQTRFESEILTSKKKRFKKNKMLISTRKKLLNKEESRGNTKSMSILDEVLADIKNKESNLFNVAVPLCQEWDVKKIKTKSSSSQEIDKMKCKTIKCNTKSEGADIGKKIDKRDFKNLMLYDSKRVKRIDTKQMINKKV